MGFIVGFRVFKIIVFIGEGVLGLEWTYFSFYSKGLVRRVLFDSLSLSFVWREEGF